MRVKPLWLDELRDATEIWAEHTMRLEEPNPRKMERFAPA